jgi:hypothetical protein
MDYEVEFPDYFDDYALEIASKGYFADLVIKCSDGTEFRPVIYDSSRLSQECGDALAGELEMFCEARVIVIAEVTRSLISRAVVRLADRNFVDLQ